MLEKCLNARRSHAEDLLRAGRAILDPDADQIIVDYLDHALRELVWRIRPSTSRISPTPELLVHLPAPASAIEERTPISEISWSHRTVNVLLLCGFRELGELLKWERDALREEVLRCPNVKKSTWLEIERVLQQASNARVNT